MVFSYLNLTPNQVDSVLFALPIVLAYGSNDFIGLDDRLRASLARFSMVRASLARDASLARVTLTRFSFLRLC